MFNKNLIKALATVSVFCSLYSNVQAHDIPVEATKSVVSSIKKMTTEKQCSDIQIKKISDCVAGSLMLDSMLVEISKPEYVNIMKENNIKPVDLLNIMVNSDEHKPALEKLKNDASITLQIIATVATIQDLEGKTNSASEQKYLKEMRESAKDSIPLIDHISKKSKFSDDVGILRSIRPQDINNLFQKFANPVLMQPNESIGQTI